MELDLILLKKENRNEKHEKHTLFDLSRVR